MPAAYVGGSSDITVTNTDTSIVATAPTGSGGRLYAVGHCVSARTISPPSGWTEVTNNDSGTYRTYLWMRADDAASDYTFTISGTFANGAVSVHRVSDASTNTPTITFATGPNDIVQTCPDVTTPSNDCLVLWGIYAASDYGPCSADKGTERLDTGVPTQAGIAVYSNLEATAGTITGAEITTTGYGAKRLYSIAIESAAGAVTSFPRPGGRIPAAIMCM